MIEGPGLMVADEPTVDELEKAYVRVRLMAGEHVLKTAFCTPGEVEEVVRCLDFMASTNHYQAKICRREAQSDRAGLRNLDLYVEGIVVRNSVPVPTWWLGLWNALAGPLHAGPDVERWRDMFAAITREQSYSWAGALPEAPWLAERLG